jgi:hypothetical protein
VDCFVTLSGCAPASPQQRRAQWSKADDAPVSDTVFEADDSTCQNVADDKGRGLAVARHLDGSGQSLGANPNKGGSRCEF